MNKSLHIKSASNTAVRHRLAVRGRNAADFDQKARNKIRIERVHLSEKHFLEARKSRCFIQTGKTQF